MVSEHISVIGDAGFLANSVVNYTAGRIDGLVSIHVPFGQAAAGIDWGLSDDFCASPVPSRKLSL